MRFMPTTAHDCDGIPLIGCRRRHRRLHRRDNSVTPVGPALASTGHRPQLDSRVGRGTTRMVSHSCFQQGTLES
jgi:hypothetical protein